MMRFRRILRATLPGERGFTLVELSVVILLTGLIGAAVVRSFVSTTQGLQKTDFRNRALSEVTVAMDHMTKVLQSARAGNANDSVLSAPTSPIRTGDPVQNSYAFNSGLQATFKADLGNPIGPSLVHWYVDQQLRLIEEITQPDYASAVATDYNTKVPTRRVLLTGVVVPASGRRPIFSWFGANSTAPLNNNPDPNVPMTREVRSVVMAVQLYLRASGSAPSSEAVAAENFVILPGAVEELGPAPWPTAPRSTLPPADPCSVCPTPAAVVVATPAPAGPAPAPPAPNGPVAGLS